MEHSGGISPDVMLHTPVISSVLLPRMGGVRGIKILPGVGGVGGGSFSLFQCFIIISVDLKPTNGEVPGCC